MYELFQLIWSVSEDGYEWQRGPMRPFGADFRKRDEPALVELGEKLRPYKPAPDLFLKFASVTADSDTEILRFANSYGLLGGGPRWIGPKPTRKGKTTTGVTGELRSHWQEHLHRIKAAVSLWEAIKADDSSVLASCIHWRRHDHITYDWPPSSELMTPWSTHATIASRGINPHLFVQFQHGDVLKPARFHLQQVVNQSLKDLVAPRLLWTAPDSNKMGFFIVPDTLIGCLWLQLAGAIADLRKFRLCEACNKPMLVAPEGSGYRTNRKTCSNACRIKLYERRKEEARRLRSEKVPVREIAKRLNTGVHEIQRWTAKR